MFSDREDSGKQPRKYLRRVVSESSRIREECSHFYRKKRTRKEKREVNWKESSIRAQTNGRTSWKIAKSYLKKFDFASNAVKKQGHSELTKRNHHGVCQKHRANRSQLLEQDSFQEELLTNDNAHLDQHTYRALNLNQNPAAIFFFKVDINSQSSIQEDIRPVKESACLVGKPVGKTLLARAFYRFTDGSSRVQRWSSSNEQTYMIEGERTSSRIQQKLEKKTRTRSNRSTKCNHRQMPSLQLSLDRVFSLDELVLGMRTYGQISILRL